MRLQRKVGIGFLVMALCVAAVNAAWLSRMHAAKMQFDEYANLTTPALIALGQIKAASLAMRHQLSEELAAADAAAPAAVRAGEQALQQARRQFDEWNAVYKGVAQGAEDRAFVNALRITGTALYARADELLESAGPDGDPSRRAEAEQELRAAEQRFVRVIDKATVAEILAMKAQRDRVAKSVDRAMWMSVAASLMAVLLAAALALFIARVITRPVARLADDVTAVGAGDLDRRTPVASRDELGDLARTFNQMTENLQRTTVSKHYMDDIIRSMADALVVLNPDGTIRMVNDAARSLLGYMDDELIGRPLHDVFRSESGGPVGGSGLGQAMRRGDLRNIEHIALAKDGRRVPVLCSGTVMHDARGLMLFVALDITERKRAEEALRRAQQELIQSEKLAALGRFSAGVAHEVKNPLGVVLGGIELLEPAVPAGDAELKTVMAMMKEAIYRADTIVRDLLRFARPSELNRQRMSARELVDGTVALLTHTGQLKRVEVATEFGQNGMQLEVDKNQIQQVLLNLIMNAVDAMPEGGTLRLATRGCRRPDGSPGCDIDVADTGEGISPEHLSKLFEPFFTTKRDKKGTGLGLSVSKTIVESHGGSLRIASEPGKGTVVTVALPAIEGGQGA